MSPELRAELTVRLIRGCELVGPCLIWTRATQSGYGTLKYQQIMYSTHRLAHELFIGPLGKNHALHSCDRKTCCNPMHIYAGTHEDNMRDLAIRGLASKGEKNPSSILTEQQVLEIRASNSSINELAEKYGVVRTTIACIRNRITWRHI